MMRAVKSWPAHGYCGTCHARTEWFEASVGDRCNLICKACGRVSAHEAQQKIKKGAHYEGFCKTCGATTLWANQKETFWNDSSELFCCNCGKTAQPRFRKDDAEVFLAHCVECGGETLWYESLDEIHTKIYCASCSRTEPITFKRWLEKAPVTMIDDNDRTRLFR